LGVGAGIHIYKNMGVGNGQTFGFTGGNSSMEFVLVTSMTAMRIL
jgi:hypothetical protein